MMCEPLPVHVDDRLVFFSVETDGLDGPTIGYACANGKSLVSERWGQPSDGTREYLRGYQADCEKPSTDKLAHLLYGRVWVTHTARFHAPKIAELANVSLPGPNFLIDLNQCLLILKMANQLQSTSLTQFGSITAVERVRQMVDLYKYIERKLET